MARRHCGFSLLLAAVILIVVVAAILAFMALLGRQRNEGNLAETTARFARANVALEQFVAATGRLPCPADPASSSGDANPNTATTLGTPCSTPAGTLPWRTIGLRSDDALDAWGWKISYRVYRGTPGGIGSLTQDQGASMVLCTYAAPASPGLDAGGRCQTDAGGHHSDRNDFLTFNLGARLGVTDFGVAHNDVAYVLISHGPSGLGAYTSSGGPNSAPTSPDEIANLSATGPFVARAASAPDVPASDAAHFDDLIAYTSLADAISGAGLGPRYWNDPTFASVAATISSVAQALNQPNIIYGDLGTQVLAFNNAQVSVQAGGSAENLTLAAIGVGDAGIGGVGGGNTLSSADSEVLHIAFNYKAQTLSFTLDGMGCRQTAGTCTDADAVQLTFFNDGVPVGSPIMKLACNPGHGLASYTVDLGASPSGDFNSVDIAPQPSVPGAAATAVLVSGFVNCPHGGSCVTTLDTGSGPGGNHCP